MQDEITEMHQESFEGFEVPKRKKRMSAKNHFIVQLNGREQQQLSIKNALVKNEVLRKQAIEEGDEAKAEYFQQCIQINIQQIQNYENLIQQQLIIAEQRGYVLDYNPLSGRRFIRATSPEDVKKVISISEKIKETLSDCFDHSIDQLSEELDTVQSAFIAEQPELIKERKFKELAEYQEQIQVIQAKIDQCWNDRSAAFNAFDDFKIEE